MAPPSVSERAQHVIDAIDEIFEAVKDKNFDAFSSDRLTRAAVERFLEIVCEASTKLSDEAKATYPNIPWPQLRSFGNILRHVYHRVDAEVVWDIVQNDLAPLRDAMTALVGKRE